MSNFGMLVPPLLPGIQNQGIADAPAAPETQSLARACQDFEAMFASTLMSGLMKTGSLCASDKTSQFQENWVWDLMIQTLAEEWGQNQDLGLAEQVARHLENQADSGG